MTDEQTRAGHCYGRHPQDPAVPHGDRVGSCPGGTPAQARQRAAAAACVRAAGDAVWAGLAAEDPEAEL